MKKIKRVKTYLISGVIIFVIMLVIGRLIGFSWAESAGAAAVMSVVGIAAIWWKEIGF